MKSVLEELYTGNIDPNTSYFERNSAYGKVMGRISENEDKLLKLLNEPEKSMFMAFMGAQMELDSLTAIEKFSIGFKLGTLLMVEVFTGKGDLVRGED